MTYYVIAYDEGIYAGTYSNEDGNYIYSSNSINRKKPKVFKTKNGAIVHLENLRNKIVYGHDINEYHFHILEWTEDELSEHLKNRC